MDAIDIWDRALRRWREAKQVEWDRQHKPRKFGASGIGGCLRASYFFRANQPETNPLPEATLSRFDLGLWLEDVLLTVLERYVLETGAGYLERGFEVASEHHVAHPDGVLHLNGRMPIVLEIKSIRPAAIAVQQRQNGGWQPYRAHELQVAQAIWLMQQAGYDVESTGLLLYQSLDGTRLFHAVELADCEEELLTNMLILERAWTTSVPPPARGTPREYPCRGCVYWGWCYGMGKGKNDY